jgi:hypothetical protein
MAPVDRPAKAVIPTSTAPSATTAATPVNLKTKSPTYYGGGIMAPQLDDAPPHPVF